jgi:hypothetical protein
MLKRIDDAGYELTLNPTPSKRSGPVNRIDLGITKLPDIEVGLLTHITGVDPFDAYYKAVAAAYDHMENNPDYPEFQEEGS